MQGKRFLSIIVCCLCMLSVFIVTSVYAQAISPGLDVTLSPSIVELIAQPGQKIAGRFRLHNNLPSPLSFSITVDKLNGDSQNGQVVPEKPVPGDTSTSWVQFDKPNFTALPNEWTTISYTISIPSDAAFGYYYAIRISQKLPHISNTTAKVQGEVVLPILLTVDHAGAMRSASLVSFSTTPYVNQYLPVTFQTVIKNTGNVLLKPTGNIFIRGTGDQDLALMDVNESAGAILPGFSRTFTNTWDDGFLVYEPIIENDIPKVDKTGQPLMHLVINWDKITSFRFGKYTANLLVAYDNGTRDVALEGTTTFWVFPYVIVAAAVIACILVLVLFRLLLHLYIQSQIRKYRTK